MKLKLLSCILLTLLICVCTDSEVISKDVTITSTGYGWTPQEEISINSQKQTAFVTSFVDGLVRLVKHIHGTKLATITKENGNNKRKIIAATSQGRIGGFTISEQGIINNYELITNMVNCEFGDETIIIKLGKLIFPIIDSVSIPNWQEMPDMISGVKVDEVNWEVGNNNRLLCKTRVAYQYDPSRIVKTGNTRPKNLNSYVYQKDGSGHYVFKRVKGEGTSYGGGGDTPNEIREKALKQALRNAVEKTNGVYIESLSQVKNGKLTKNEIMAKTLGIAKVVDKEYSAKFNTAGNYEVTCTVISKVPIMLLGQD
jgi:hypothetical protein